jgi:TolA-binding protein
MKELGFDLIPEDEKLYMKYLVGLSEQVRSQDLSSYNQSNLDPAVDSIAGYKDQVSQHITDIQTLNQNIEETQNQIEQLQQEIAQLTAQKESYLARAAQYGKYLTGTVYLEGALGILTGAIAKFKGTSTLPYLIVKAGGVRVARAQ